MAKRRTRREPKARASDVAAVRREAKKGKFLEGFLKCGTKSGACRRADVSASTVATWLEHDPEFAEAFTAVREEYIERLEEEVDRRAFRGVRKNRWFRDQHIEEYREYSDLLAMFRLKALRPEVYRERTEVRQDSEVTIKIEDDPNWYGNADRLETTESAGAPAADPPE